MAPKFFAFTQTLSLALIKMSYNFRILNIIVASKPNTASLNGSKGQLVSTEDKDYHSINGQALLVQNPPISKVILNRFFKKLIFTLHYSLFMLQQSLPWVLTSFIQVNPFQDTVSRIKASFILTHVRTSSQIFQSRGLSK